MLIKTVEIRKWLDSILLHYSYINYILLGVVKVTTCSFRDDTLNSLKGQNHKLVLQYTDIRR
jgi:hypothetical protein